MSDVMPYRSSVWSQMEAEQLARYRDVWRRRLAEVVEQFAPDLIHANHVWIVASLVKEVAPHLPALTTCHATGLRQMELCPHLREEVARGCRRLDRFCVLREDHREQLASVLDIAAERITVTGVGYRDELFHPRGAATPAERAGQLLYVGKYSAAKGLPWLLDAVERLAVVRPEDGGDETGRGGRLRPGVHLHVAGSGAGAEADELRARMAAMPMVTRHGQLEQPALAELMRRCAVCVLPSFYEGVPLVLVEAVACGCRVVATDLPGVGEQIAPMLGDLLTTVPMPRLRGVDRPEASDLPRFVADLATGLEAVLAAAGRDTPASADLTRRLESFTWSAVQRRVEQCWRELLV
jgi:glycosyltransferase involved in cell wall biosynthesis